MQEDEVGQVVGASFRGGDELADPICVILRSFKLHPKTAKQSGRCDHLLFISGRMDETNSYKFLPGRPQVVWAPHLSPGSTCCQVPFQVLILFVATMPIPPLKCCACRRAPVAPVVDAERPEGLDAEQFQGTLWDPGTLDQPFSLLTKRLPRSVLYEI